LIRDASAESHKQAAGIISGGGLIAFRTDTLYGLGADPFNREAVLRIKRLKGREESKPILIVISDYDQLPRFIDDISPAFELLAKQFWPGALTLIGTAHASVPEEITAGTKSLGVRLPADDRVRAIVRSCGGALTATSANPSNAAPARNAREVREYFGDAIDLIIDDGEVESDLPSTVVDVSSAEPRLIREGVIRWAAIQDEFRRFV
jgi:L-threonylcarbamoyladenylate synthase